MNVKRGMLAYDQTEVEKFNLNSEKPFVVTDTGCTIQCKKVIFCSGFETTKLLKEKSLICFLLVFLSFFVSFFSNLFLLNFFDNF